jgi:hypothetical protein
MPTRPARKEGEASGKSGAMYRKAGRQVEHPLSRVTVLTKARPMLAHRPCFIYRNPNRTEVQWWLTSYPLRRGLQRRRVR